jgi:hypothetical protein
VSKKPRLGPESVVARNGEIAFRELDGEVVMLSIQTGKYYSLDTVGSRVWELIAEPKSVRAVCEELVKEYEVDLATCEADVLAFLDKLAADDLVRVIDAPPP